MVNCVAGSKVKFTSMLHMAWELFSILAGYSIFRTWVVRAPTDKFTLGPQ